MTALLLITLLGLLHLDGGCQSGHDQGEQQDCQTSNTTRQHSCWHRLAQSYHFDLISRIFCVQKIADSFVNLSRNLMPADCCISIAAMSAELILSAV